MHRRVILFQKKKNILEKLVTHLFRALE